MVTVHASQEGKGYVKTISGKGLVSLRSFVWTNAHGRLLKSQDICPKMFDLKMVALCADSICVNLYKEPLLSCVFA